MRPDRPDWYLITILGLNHENRIGVAIGCLHGDCRHSRTEFKEKPEDALKLWQKEILIDRDSKI